MLAKKEQQGTKIQELYHKLATVQQVIKVRGNQRQSLIGRSTFQNRETLERTIFVIRDEVERRKQIKQIELISILG